MLEHLLWARHCVQDLSTEAGPGPIHREGDPGCDRGEHGEGGGTQTPCPSRRGQAFLTRSTLAAAAVRTSQRLRSPHTALTEISCDLPKPTPRKPKRRPACQLPPETLLSTGSWTQPSKPPCATPSAHGRRALQNHATLVSS